MDLQLTTEMLWLGALMFALADIPLALLLAHRISAARFQAIGRLVVAITAIFWFGLWLWVVTAYWWAVYAHVFPPWSRWYLPAFQAVLTAAVASVAIRVSQRWAGHPVLNYCLMGGLWGVLTHLWALLQGITTRPPALQGVHPLGVVVIAFFEFIFYWCIILVLAMLSQAILRRVQGSRGGLMNTRQSVYSEGEGLKDEA